MAKMKMGGTVQNSQVNATSSKKLHTRDLIYAGAFGAIYLVVMLIIVMASDMIPILYLAVPLTVGAVCGTIYEMCVLKVHKFGAALILGILFALVSCTSEGLISVVPAIAAAALAELIIFLGKYKSKFMYLLSFVVFNLNVACPFIGLQVARDEFLARCVEFYGQDYANQLAALAPDWIILLEIGLAIVGGIIGAFIASKLIKKHFRAAGVM